MDIIAQGKSGWNIHKEKDEPSKWLGRGHRIIRHNEFIEWQIKFLKISGLKTPVYLSPQKLVQNLKTFSQGKMTFEEAAHITHEYFDEIWSTLSQKDKMCWGFAFRDITLNPTKYFKNRILYPEDILLPEFQKLQEFVKNRTLEELI